MIVCSFYYTIRRKRETIKKDIIRFTFIRVIRDLYDTQKGGHNCPNILTEYMCNYLYFCFDETMPSTAVSIFSGAPVLNMLITEDGRKPPSSVWAVNVILQPLTGQSA